MKTVVSIPDEVFYRAVQFAEQMRRTRSDVFGSALKEYIERHAPDEIFETVNRVCGQRKEPSDVFSKSAARRVLRRVEW